MFENSYLTYVIYLFSTTLVFALFERSRLSQKIDILLNEVYEIKDELYCRLNIV
jgi:hypothetical protein